jgi:type IV secretory pathway VirB10-like protein
MDRIDYEEDGDPYGIEDQRRRGRRVWRVRPWVWGLGGLVVLGVLAYGWTARQGYQVPLVDHKADVIVSGPDWDGYTERLKAEQAVQRVAFERDLRVDELQRKLAAMEQAEAEQNRLLQQLLNRKETEQKAAEAAKQPPKPKRHRDMGYIAFELSKDTRKEEPLYTLAPGKTKIPCIMETKANSDVENGATVKVTTRVFDTATGQKLLIPQDAVVSQRYMSKDLIHGNQRLPMFSTLLTVSADKVVDLEDDLHTLDAIGQAGLVTRVNNHFWRAVPALVIRSVGEGSVASVSGANPYASSAARNTSQYANNVTQPWIDLRPTIEVDPGEGCVIILTRTIQLSAYKEKG